MKRFYITVINSEIGIFGRILSLILLVSSVVITCLLLSKNLIESIGALFAFGFVIFAFAAIIWMFLAFYINFVYWTFTELSIFQKIVDIPKKVIYFIFKLIFGDWEKCIFIKEKNDGKK